MIPPSGSIISTPTLRDTHPEPVTGPMTSEHWSAALAAADKPEKIAQHALNSKSVTPVAKNNSCQNAANVGRIESTRKVRVSIDTASISHTRQVLKRESSNSASQSTGSAINSSQSISVPIHADIQRAHVMPKDSLSTTDTKSLDEPNLSSISINSKKADEANTPPVYIDNTSKSCDKSLSKLAVVTKLVNQPNDKLSKSTLAISDYNIPIFQTEKISNPLANANNNLFSPAISLPSVQQTRPLLISETLPAITVVNLATVPSDLAASISAIQKSGQTNAVLRLNPPELGSISIHVSVDQNALINVLFVPTVPQTAQLLHNNLDDLRQTMTAAGLSLGDAQIGNGQTRGGHSDYEPQKNKSSPSQSSNLVNTLSDARGVRALA